MHGANMKIYTVHIYNSIQQNGDVPPLKAGLRQLCCYVTKPYNTVLLSIFAARSL